VTDIMGEINSASAEQSAGVTQVGEAIGQMDQATQQNAALVEESAAAAASLKQQARQLVQSVAVFKLGSGDPQRAVAARTAVAPTPHTAVSDRRGPDRAKNVVRPAFKPVAQASSAPTARTGTDDWESF